VRATWSPAPGNGVSGNAQIAMGGWLACGLPPIKKIFSIYFGFLTHPHFLFLID
jgi:hypothetical protein